MFFEYLGYAVFSCIVPIMYLVILFFAFFIIRAAPSKELKFRSIVGVLGGVLLSLAFVIVDLTATGFAELSVDPSNIVVVIPVGIVSAIFGFIILLAIDLFMKKGAASFVVFFIVTVSLVSGYFLIRATNLKAVISLSTVMFLLGNVIYIMMNFSIVRSFLNFTNTSVDKKPEDSRWKVS